MNLCPDGVERLDDEKKRKNDTKLTWKDHLALFMALTETVMVPALVLIIILLIIIVYFAMIR